MANQQRPPSKESGDIILKRPVAGLARPASQNAFEITLNTHDELKLSSYRIKLLDESVDPIETLVLQWTVFVALIPTSAARAYRLVARVR